MLPYLHLGLDASLLVIMTAFGLLLPALTRRDLVFVILWLVAPAH